MPRLREFRWDSWANAAYVAWTRDQPTILALDTETTGLGFYDRPFAATLTWRTQEGALTSWYFDLEAVGREAREEILSDILLSTPAWVGHNLKFDLQKLTLIDVLDDRCIEGHELHDTQTIFHLLDENQPKGLKKLAVSVLRYDDTVEVEVKSGPNRGMKKRVPKEEHRLNAVRRKLGLRKEDGYHLLPREVLIPYALRDTDFTLRLYETLMPRLRGLGDEKLLALYASEMELTRTFLRMEADGLDLDLTYLERTASAYGVRVMEGWQQIVSLTGRPDFNPGSVPQITDVFAQRGIHLENTQAATLEGLDDELARAIVQYREDQKLYKTYLKGLMDEQRDGRVHPWFNSTGARTGRTSSGSAKE